MFQVALIVYLLILSVDARFITPAIPVLHVPSPHYRQFAICGQSDLSLTFPSFLNITHAICYVNSFILPCTHPDGF